MQQEGILAIIAGTTLLGSFVQSVSGFGYAIIVMSVLPLFVSIQTSSVLEVFTSSVMVCVIALKYRKNIRWKFIAIPLAANAVFGYVGICIQSAVPDTQLRRILGGCLILLSLWLMRPHTSRKVLPWVVAGLLAGTLSGLMGGMMSIGGPPMVLYCLSITDSKEEYTATLQTYFFFSTLYLFLMHLVMGHMTPKVWEYSLAALAGLGAGTTVGLKVFHSIRQNAFQKVVCAFMIMAGIYMLVS